MNCGEVSTHGTVKKDAVEAGAFPVTALTCLITDVRCCAIEAAMAACVAAMAARGVGEAAREGAPPAGAMVSEAVELSGVGAVGAADGAVAAAGAISDAGTDDIVVAAGLVCPAGAVAAGGAVCWAGAAAAAGWALDPVCAQATAAKTATIHTRFMHLPVHLSADGRGF